MTIAATNGRSPVPIMAWLARTPLWAWVVLAVGLFGALNLWFDASRLVTSLGDSDDATRLIEVRELMAGASWFDMTLARFGGAHPLVSHWSRLIDLPIAVLLSTFELVLPPPQAELATRAVWPLLVLFAFVFLLAREAQFRGGRAAALLSIPLALTCLVGIVQFLPGRIDHHGAIIVCTVIGILRLARSFDDADAGWSAGLLLGLGLAIGFEALALTTVSLTAAVLFGLLPGRSLLGPSRAAVAFAATLGVALAITTAPDTLFTAHCDALSINIVALAATSAFGVSVVQALEPRLSLIAKLGALSATGLVALSLYALSEPACLAGPFGQVDPAIFPIWLGKVSETQSVLSLSSRVPLVGGMALAYFSVGLYCGVKLIWTDRDDGVRFHVLVLLLAIPLSLWQIKLMPYATYLPITLLAVTLARPPQTAQTQMSKRALVLAALGGLVVVGVVSWALLTLSAPSVNRVLETKEASQKCRANSAITPLAQLPKGLVVADVDLGPFIVALTNLDVLAAPYHRLDKSIIEADHILNGTPAEAERRLRNVGARYIVTCEGIHGSDSEKAAPDALETLLMADKPPSFLEPVPLSAPTPLKVWRVKP